MAGVDALRIGPAWRRVSVSKLTPRASVLGWLGTTPEAKGAIQAHQSHAVYSGALSPAQHKSSRRPG